MQIRGIINYIFPFIVKYICKKSISTLGVNIFCNSDNLRNLNNYASINLPKNATIGLIIEGRKPLNSTIIIILIS